MARTRGIARHGRLRHRHAWPTLATVVASALAVVLVSAGSLAAIAAVSLTGSISSVHLSPQSTTSGTAAFQGAANIVVVGSDSRVGQREAAAGPAPGARNDVTMLVHISADHTQLTVVSIPRDLITAMPACTDPDTGTTTPAQYAMFNSALGAGGTEGGLACVVDAVGKLTGLQAAYGGVVQFDGVAAMSTAVGGVQVCVARAIDDPYTGLHLSAGEHLIEGNDAQAFLRTRHGLVGGGDLSRISNQQLFLSALVRKVTEPGGALSNPLTLYKLARAALANMQLSDSLDNAGTMVSLARTVRGMDLSNVLFVQWPTLPDPQNSAHVITDPDAAPALVAALANDTPTTLSGTTGSGAVVAPSSGTTSGTTSGTSGSGTSGSSSAGSSGSSGTGSSSTGSSSTGSTSTPSPTTTSLPSAITGQSAAQQTCSQGDG